MEKVPRNEADEVFYKQKDLISLTSSTASGPLDVCEANSTVACNMLSIGEGFGKIAAAQPSVIFFDCRGDHWSSEVVTVTKCISVCYL